MSIKRKRLLATLLGLMLVAENSYAKTVFYCETQNGKKVEVQDLGNIINYRFGTELFNPELELTVPRSSATQVKLRMPQTSSPVFEPKSTLAMLT